MLILIAGFNSLHTVSVFLFRYLTNSPSGFMVLKEETRTNTALN